MTYKEWLENEIKYRTKQLLELDDCNSSRADFVCGARFSLIRALEEYNNFVEGEK